VVLAFRFFYVAGPALAVWAVIISVIGFTRPEFPRRIGAQRLVIGLTLLLMLTVVLSATIGAKFEHTEKKAGAAAQQKPPGG
jgi:ABC-type proline/glycine betaine transport system permease subunit